MAWAMTRKSEVILSGSGCAVSGSPNKRLANTSFRRRVAGPTMMTGRCTKERHHGVATSQPQRVAARLVEGWERSGLPRKGTVRGTGSRWDVCSAGDGSSREMPQ